MGDDLRERVARAIANATDPYPWEDRAPHEHAEHLKAADAALAEIGGVREEYCAKCGAPRSNHPYRHPFEARKFTRSPVEMGKPEPGVRDEGSDMKLAYDAYRKGQRDALDGIRVADPRVILSRVRAIAEGKE
jgi:hypothetical protein